MSSLFSLQARRTLVTGASSGIGAHFARVVASAGAEVTLAARRTDKLKAGVAAIRAAGGKAHAIAMDVTDPASVIAGVVEATRLMGGIDLLLNNAGIAETKPWLAVEEEDFQAVLNTNLSGAYRVARAVAQGMTARGTGGVIVNTASILGLAITGSLGPYTVSKAGLVQMTRSMALEFARHSIRVNALCPGYILTEINREFLEGPTGDGIKKRIPMRRIGEVADLEGPLLLLASDAGRFMTGTTVAVDGGHLLSPL